MFRQRALCSGAISSVISSSTSVVKSLISVMMQAPGLSTLPVIARKQQIARCVGATLRPDWSMPRPDTSAAAWARPNQRAAVRTSSADTPQNSATYSGV